MKSNYPRMLYPQGDPAGDPVVVLDEEQETIRRKEGYLRLGDAKAEKRTAPPVVATTAEAEPAPNKAPKPAKPNKAPK